MTDKEKLRRALDALFKISKWRDSCHDHDADMGHQLRDFDDDEEWDLVERFAFREWEEGGA
jgi:hypothetical protein